MSSNTRCHWQLVLYSILIYCSDFRLCNRGLKEYAASEEMEELRTETDSVRSENQDDTDECVSSNLVHKSLCEKEEGTEWPDDPTVDEEFAQDVEQMKLMGLPLSFTASKRREKKVNYVVLCIKATVLDKLWSCDQLRARKSH